MSNFLRNEFLSDIFQMTEEEYCWTQCSLVDFKLYWLSISKDKSDLHWKL